MHRRADAPRRSPAWRTASVAVSEPSVPTTIDGSRDALLSCGGDHLSGEELANLAGDARRIVLHQEVAGVVEHDQLGPGSSLWKR